ncbi:MAG: VacJ family lipoprotein [Alphaproteobacteria bacterium]
MKVQSHYLFYMVLLLFAGGCSTAPEGQFSESRDPYEDGNRKVYAFNMGVDTYVLEPVASSYLENVPPRGQTAIGNHVRWAGMPSTAINSTLQGKFENAGLATLNFLVNGLTLGFADLTEDDAPISKADFGQTLAAADVPEGSYLMVPLLGPRTTRSLAGTVVDTVLDPVGMLAAGSGAQALSTMQAPLGAVTFRADNFDAFNDVKYNAIDPYARTRSIYLQSRDGMTGQSMDRGIGTSDSDDEFDAFFNEAQ